MTSWAGTRQAHSTPRRHMEVPRLRASQAVRACWRRRPARAGTVATERRPTTQLRLDLAGHSAQTPGRQQSAPHTVNGRLLASRLPTPTTSPMPPSALPAAALPSVSSPFWSARTCAIFPKKPPSPCANAMPAALLDIPYPSSTLGLGFARDGHSANPQWKE
jgi:hypothetical protein